MGFISKVKEGISNKYEADKKFRTEVREATMKTKREQAIRVAQQREIIRANATLIREKARYQTSPKQVFVKSVAPKNIKKKLKKYKRKGVDRGVQAAVKQTQHHGYNPIMGKGMF